MNDNIKEKVAKLLRLAGDDSAAEGEVKNAMAAANQLLAKYQLTREDIDMDDESPLKNIVYGKRTVTTLQWHIRGWENMLSRFICEFIGSVDCYQNGSVPFRKAGIQQFDDNGKPQTLQSYVFFGSDDDVQYASELWFELQEAISSMGVLRWGSFWRGDGAAYCEGFVGGLRSAHIESIVALEDDENSSKYMLKVQDTQLAIKDGATDWLAKNGIKLRKVKQDRGTTRGSAAAKAEGKSDGSNYSPNQRKKYLS